MNDRLIVMDIILLVDHKIYIGNMSAVPESSAICD